MLVAKNPEFGSEVYIKDRSGDEKRLGTAAKCEVSKQIVTVLKSAKPMDDGELASVVEYVVQVKVLNPLDVNIQLNTGDIIIVCRAEKTVSSDDPDFVTYTMKKSETKQQKEKESEAETETESAEKKKKSKKTKKQKKDEEKKKKKEEKENKKKEKAKEKASTEENFDFDALDFELSEEEEVEEPESDISLSDMSDTEIEADATIDLTSDVDSADKSTEKAVVQNGKAPSAKPNKKPTPPVRPSNVVKVLPVLIIKREKDPVPDPEPTEKIDLNGPNSDFYKKGFYGVLYQMGGGLSLASKAKSMVVLRIESRGPYVSHHMFQKKCCVSINEDLLKPELVAQKRHNIMPRIETVKKSSEGFPIVNAFLENTTAEKVYYKNGSQLATIMFTGEVFTGVGGSVGVRATAAAVLAAVLPLPVAAPVPPSEPPAAVYPVVQPQPPPAPALGKPYTPPARVVPNPVTPPPPPPGEDSDDDDIIIETPKANSPKEVITITTPPPGEELTSPAQDMDISMNQSTSMENTTPKSYPTPHSTPSITTPVATTTPARATTPPPGEEPSPLKRPLDEPNDEDVYAGLDGVDALTPAPIPAAKKLRQEAPEITNSEENMASPRPKPHFQSEPVIIKPSQPLPSPPRREELSKLTVKVLKSILIENDLSTSGLKQDIVKRVLEFYTENRDKIRPDLIKKLGPETVASPTIALQPSEASDELENFEGSSAVIYSAEVSESQKAAQKAALAAKPDEAAKKLSELVKKTREQLTKLTEQETIKTMEPKTNPTETVGNQIPTLLNKTRQTPEKSRLDPDSAFTGWYAKEKKSAVTPGKGAVSPALKSEYACAIENKKAEQKALDSLALEFHEKPHFINLNAALEFKEKGENLAYIRLTEVEVFLNDLADRRILVKRDLKLGAPMIKRQICKVVLEGRVPKVEVIIDSNNLSIQPMTKFLKIQIERTDKDSSDQFNLPLNNVFDDGVEAVFDLDNPAIATTIADVVLLPKESVTFIQCWLFFII